MSLGEARTVKKSVYITYRKNGDKKTPQIIFNDSSTGERMAVLSVPALYKRVYAEDFRKLNNLPSDDYWTEKRIMDLAFKALEKGLVEKSDRSKDSLSFIEYATKIWTFEDSPRVARLNREKAGTIHKSHADEGSNQKCY